MADKKKFSYDEAINQVEQIVSKLENQEANGGFDGMVDDVQKAMKLLEQCRAFITETESKLSDLSTK